MFFPKIPTRIYGTGDINSAKKYIGFAKKLLGDLNTSLSFNSLPTGSKIQRLANGTTITCTVNYGITKIFIDSPVSSQVSGGESRKCFCSPCFAFGIIIEESKNEDGTLKVTTEDWLDGSSKLYDVEICNIGNYLTLKDVPAKNWAMAYEGQWVLVTVNFKNKDYYDYVHGKTGFDAIKCVTSMNTLENVNLSYQITPVTANGEVKWKLIQA